MPVTEAFLASCRTQIDADPVLTTYRTAYGLYDAASQANKGVYWNLTFSDSSGVSPAMALKQLIRGTVLSLADTTLNGLERESAYRTLSGEYVAQPQPPKDAATEMAELQQLLLLEGIS